MHTGSVNPNTQAAFNCLEGIHWDSFNVQRKLTKVRAQVTNNVIYRGGTKNNISTD